MFNYSEVVIEEIEKQPLSRTNFYLRKDDLILEMSCEFIVPGSITEFSVDNMYFHHICPNVSRLFLFLNGGACIEVNGRNYELVPRQIYLIPSGQEFRVTYQRSDLFHFHFRVLDAIGMSVFSDMEGIPSLADAGNLYDEMVKSYISGQQMVCLALAFQAVSRFCEPLMDSMWRRARSISKYRALLSHIQENISPAMRIDQLADFMNMSRSALSKAFRRDMGISLKEYLTWIQMERAMNLLSSTDLTIEEIVFQLGYTNAPYFYRSFKKIVGESPGKYRQLNTEEKLRLSNR
ncbi:MAG: helix-turn-helix transcriptional regulator [Anaerolineae bacterium]|nr:helix-turn-helix transcriptional regulator [Anaerolineae bacterium]